jgi:DNA repair protein RecO (recombination protein O)
MNQKVTRAIILKRVNYAESDRIVTVLTPNDGRLSLIAKGVRKVKSKLAGGLELFSVIDITYIKGRGEVDTLVSARLVKFYDHILRDIDRVEVAYELLKTVSKIVEDQYDKAYFELVEQVFELLNEPKANSHRIRTWYLSRLLLLGGHQPNLLTDVNSGPLVAGNNYVFDLESMTFEQSLKGSFGTSEIKLLRLLFNQEDSKTLFVLTPNPAVESEVGSLVEAMARTQLSL